MLKSGMTVWFVTEYNEIECTKIIEQPKGSGNFYYYDGIKDVYENATSAYLTEKEAEESLQKDKHDFIKLTKKKEALLALLFDGWLESIERNNEYYTEEQVQLVKEAIQTHFGVEVEYDTELE